MSEQSPGIDNTENADNTENTENTRYNINLHHGDLHLILASDDVYFISRQMDKWLQVFLDDSYTPLALAPPAESKPAVEPVQQKIVPPPAPMPVQTPPAPEPVQTEQPVSQPEPEPAPEPTPVQEPVQAAVPEQQVPFQPAEVQQEPAPEPVPEPAPAPESQQPQQQQVSLPGEAPTPQPAPPPAPEPPADENDFEAVMDSLMKDLDDGDSTPPATGVSPGVSSALPPDMSQVAPTQRAPQPAAAPAPAPAPAQTNGNGHQNGQVNLDNVQSLVDLCDRASANTSEDFLLLSAFYLTQFEGVEKFSLKRVNSILVKSGFTPVNHSVLESGISSQFLAMVPDLTGTAEVSEYALTEQGKQHATTLL